MSVTKEQVLATAALSRIDLYEGRPESEAEKAVSKIAAQMDEIVGYMDILNQVDTTGVEPMYSPDNKLAPPRPDVVEQRLTVEEVMQNAPKRQGNFFAVPPVI